MHKPCGRWPSTGVLDRTQKALAAFVLILGLAALAVQLRQLACHRQPTYTILHTSTSSTDLQGADAASPGHVEASLASLDNHGSRSSRGGSTSNFIHDASQLSFAQSSGGGGAGRRSGSSLNGRMRKGISRARDSRSAQPQQSTVHGWAQSWGDIAYYIGEGLNPRRMANCVNERFTPKNMTWAAAMADDTASLKALGVWWSRKQASIPVTLVTQVCCPLSMLSCPWQPWFIYRLAHRYLHSCLPASTMQRGTPGSPCTAVCLDPAS